MKKVNLKFELQRKVNIYGEYVVRCFIGNKRFIDGYYYTEDWLDAYETIERFARDFGLIIYETSDGLVVAS